jgi:hypothetical protein
MGLLHGWRALRQGWYIIHLYMMIPIENDSVHSVFAPAYQERLAMARFAADIWQSPRSRMMRYVFAVITVTIVISTFLLRNTYGQSSAPPLDLAAPESPSPEHTTPVHASPPYQFVAPSLKNDDTAWLGEYFPEWKANVYVVDDQNASLTVPENKGHEAMAYLT